jgi:hypothetical protein
MEVVVNLYLQVNEGAVELGDEIHVCGNSDNDSIEVHIIPPFTV